MKITKLSLWAVGFAMVFLDIPFAVAQTALGSGIPTVPTNLPNIRTFSPPPVTFNPAIASPEALQQYGFPPRPDQLKAPAAYNAWAKAVSAPQTRLQSPQLVQTPIYNGSAQIQPFRESKQPAGEFNSNPSNSIATASSNWSGYADYDNTTKPFARSYIYAYWIVPVAQHAFGNSSGGWDYSSQWVGIDGYGSPDVLQAGTEADAYASGPITATFYAGWIEWSRKFHFDPESVRFDSGYIRNRDVIRIHRSEQERGSYLLHFRPVSHERGLSALGNHKRSEDHIRRDL
jgi:Peptidase A4 family